MVFAVVSAFQLEGSFSFLGVAFGFASLFPLYGFVRQRRCNPRWLWLLLFAVSALATVVVVGICVFTSISRLSLMPAAVAAAIVILGGPYLFAVHQYIFRSPHLWT